MIRLARTAAKVATLWSMLQNIDTKALVQSPCWSCLSFGLVASFLARHFLTPKIRAHLHCKRVSIGMGLKKKHRQC